MARPSARWKRLAYGAQVCLVKGAYDDAYDYACKLQKEKGYTFIHPFNDAEVIAGRVLSAWKFWISCPTWRSYWFGGRRRLISGVAYAIKHLHPECKVYGVQAAARPACGIPCRSMRPSRLTAWPPLRTALP
ncbi:MAG: pyridoxal-phosphate dependent enzyme [Ruthenibacterium lactatiformans]